MFKLQSYLLHTAKTLSPLITRLESHIYKDRQKCSTCTPIFIIGSPRSGSTVIYQMLTHTLDCLYIDNLIYIFFNNLPFGFWLSNKFFGNTSHNSFNSSFGNTNSWHSPSECGGFWYRWFPRSHDFIDHEELANSSSDEIRENINSIMAKYKKSIIFKNLNAGQRIRVLHKIFPDAKFIFIRRDPLYTTQSLFLARRKIKIPDDKWWSVKPWNHKELNNLPIIEKLVSQVYYIEKQITEDLKNIPANNVFEINYTDYKSEFKNLIAFTGCKIRNELDIESFDFTNKNSLSDKHLKSLMLEIKKHDWGSIGYV